MQQTESSTGHKRDVRRHTGAAVVADNVDPEATAEVAPPPQRGQAGTPISGCAPDGSPSFLDPAPKSRVRGVNANPRKQHYIFGRKGSQVGYFHITTKEAYAVLEQRAKVKAGFKGQNIAITQCCTLGLCSKSQYMKDLKEELGKVKDVQLIARERAKVTGPGAAVQLPARLQKNTDHFSQGGVWYCPDFYYDAGGGCGAYGGSIASGTGDCAAGACGGGGDGAAGCGGSKCGGGGCGGGGGGGGGCGG